MPDDCRKVIACEAALFGVRAVTKTNASTTPRFTTWPLGMLCALLLALSMSTAYAQSSQDLRVVRISPAGDDVPRGQQIVVQFNRPVVPLGTMTRPAHLIPIRIKPRLDCRWRWLDQSALACDLPADQRFARATRYRLSIDPGITAVDGTRMEERVEHSFVTARPRAQWANVHRWLSAELPVVRVTFDQAVSRDSVRAHLYLHAPAVGSHRESMRVEAAHNSGLAVLTGKASAAQLAHGALLASNLRRTWLVAPRAALRADSEYALRIEPGVLGTGPQAGVEQRTLMTVATFPAFAFKGIRCTDVHTRNHIDISPAESRSGPGRCDPLSSVALLFSAPVHGADLKQALEMQPQLAAGRENYDPWSRVAARHAPRSNHRRGALYAAWLPELLQAHQGYRLQTSPASLNDAFLRSLQSAIDMQFGTAHRRPKLHISHPNAVLESSVDSEVPVYVTNLKALQLRYRTTADEPPGIDGTQRVLPHTQRLEIPQAADIAFAVPMQARKLLAGSSGAIYGTISTDPPTDDRHERWFFAQVTPFSVTVKLGHFSSVAWVTRLDTGMPVAGAKLRVYADRYDSLSTATGDARADPVVTDSHGIATLPGGGELDADLQLRQGWRRNTPRLFVKVQHEGELALLPLDNDFRVWTRDVWPDPKPVLGHLRAWGTTAQGIYRAGDTIQYKLYVRHQDTHTLTAAPPAGYRLSVLDPKGEALVDKVLVSLNRFGALDGEIKLPQQAAVGWYRFELHSESAKRTLQAFRVLVSDFTPSPFKVRTLLNGDAFSIGDTLRVDTVASMHAGGPYTNAPARITVRVAARALRPSHPLASRFHFDTSTHDASAAAWNIVHQDQRALDGRGERDVSIALADYGVLYGRIQAESAVSDDRGKRVTALAAAQFSARDRFVGLRSPKWLHTQDQATRIEYLVVDSAGNPVENVPVALSITREEVFSARVKGAGNTYETRYERRWVDAGSCSARAELDASDCHFTPRHAGRYRIRASIADSEGRAHASELTTWVQGSTRVTWQQPEDGALNIIAERERYQVGDIARFLVHNPYPGAQALITIERYGVLRSWSQALPGSTPVIEFKVQPDDLPGFHLSVTVMSPRVQAPPPQRGQIDLGKPAMRMGYARVPVDDAHKRLQIDVRPQRDVYKPRATARIDFQVREQHSGARVNEPVELVVAVLDEAVFDLIGAGSANFDPYRGFYSLDSLDVVSYALLTRLVGRQKFESKGASSGGDGGGQALGLRDVFKFVSYWNPSVAVGSDGRASVEVQLPDNLTAWRVLALAVTRTDRLGLGEGQFKVNKDTELRPVMPNQLRAGDRFDAGFTVLNRHAEARTLQVTLSARGDALAAPSEITRSVTLAGFARERLLIPLTTVKAGDIQVRAQAVDEIDSDNVLHRLKVHDTRRLDVAASYGDIGDEHGNEAVVVDIAVPAQALAGHGSIALLATPSVIGNTAGAFSYMRDYPYMCWEQRLSKGVMASHYQSLKPHLPDDLQWPESLTLPTQMLADASRFQAPNGGMCYWQADDTRVSPYLSAYTAIAFDWLRRAGEAPPSAVQQRLDDYLRGMLRRDVLPAHYSLDMASSVRAVALAALARRGGIDAGDVLRHRTHLPRMSIFAKAHYLEATWLTLGNHELVDEALAALLAHGHQSGGKFALSEAVGNADESGNRYLLDTPARANCAALSSLSAVAKSEQLATQVLPLAQKMVRAISAARGRRDHWQNTQENAFCMAALADYARQFEAVTPDLVLSASVDNEPLGSLRFSSFKDPASSVSRPIRPSDLGVQKVMRIERGDSQSNTPGKARGRAYWSARVSYALADSMREPVAAGMQLRREFSVQRNGEWTLLTSPMLVQRGELVRVDLYLSLPSARHFVVVDDPVPGALEPVNRDLATSSVVDADSAVFQAAQDSWWHERKDWRGYRVGHWSFYHQELRHDAARFFSDYLPAGDYHLSYAAQVIATGQFSVRAPLAQEMYDPDIYATGRPASIRAEERIAP